MTELFLTKDQIDCLMTMVYLEIDPYLEDMQHLDYFDVEAITDLGNLYKILSMARDRIISEDSL